jgi:hypothetical protein
MKAVLDQMIRKSIRDSEGRILGFEPTTYHYTFGTIGDDICGGFYVKVGAEVPEVLECETEEQTLMVTIPKREFKLDVKKEGK